MLVGYDEGIELGVLALFQGMEPGDILLFPPILGCIKRTYQTLVTLFFFLAALHFNQNVALGCVEPPVSELEFRSLPAAMPIPGTTADRTGGSFSPGDRKKRPSFYRGQPNVPWEGPLLLPQGRGSSHKPLFILRDDSNIVVTFQFLRQENKQLSHG